MDTMLPPEDSDTQADSEPPPPPYESVMMSHHEVCLVSVSLVAPCHRTAATSVACSSRTPGGQSCAAARQLHSHHGQNLTSESQIL